jgi:hypothetical protein
MFSWRPSKPIIKYGLLDTVSLKLSPIKQHIPKWYKDTPQFLFDTKPKFLPDGNLSLKYCIPFLDSLTTGYAVQLNCDILVEQTENGPFLSWGVGTPLSVRDSGHAPTFPIPEGHSNTHFIWKVPLIYSLPKEYSVLFTHPLNRYDLPFTTVSGIIDGGFSLPSGNAPFFVKTNFEGVIPRGTPIAQLIPFLRQSWSSVEEPDLVKDAEIEKDLARSKISGWYKQNRWQKKEFK